MTGLCLWSGTLAGHDLWTRIRAAGRTGFGSLSVAPWELAAVLAGGDDRRLAGELGRHGVRLGCLDPVPTWLPGPVPAHPAHRVHVTVPAGRCLELAERFGIGLVNAIDVSWRPLPGAAPSYLAEFAAQAGRRGITVVVEAQVYSAIPSLAAAADLCRAAGPELRLLVDAWHFCRDRTSQIADLRSGRVGALQLADGPAHAGADPVVESTTGRRMPGDGSFPLAELAASVPPDCLVGPEVFTARVPVDRADEVAATALASTRRVLPALRPS
jgi:sugar phosphate isomerase/epimerase